MRIVSDQVVEKIKIRVLYSIVFFRKSRRLWDNVEKIWYSRTGHNDIMAHVPCRLDT